MSGIGGVLLPGGTPDPASVDMLARALVRRGRQGLTCITDGGLALVHAALRAPTADEPELLRRGALVLAWDGRLDNRGELEAALGARAESDLDAVARTYERHGPAFLEPLVGDFALALWDGRERRLILARDPLGVRPLSWARSGDALVFASTSEAVRRATGVSREIDEDWIAGYFAHAIDPERTPWRAVHAVPPGHALICQGAVVRTHAFWTPRPRPPLRLADDGEYEQRFAELFVDAVRCRLRGRAPVAAELSGGLDSSSIVCVADRLLREGRAPAGGLVTVSQVYDVSPSSDERRFMRVIEEHVGRPGVHVSEQAGPAFADLDRPDYEFPLAHECLKARERRVLAVLREHGALVLLSGFGGDQLLHSEYDGALPLADLLHAGRAGAFVRALAAWHAFDGTPYPQLVARSFVRAFLPGLERRAASPGARSILACLMPGFVRRTGMRARLAAPVPPERSGAPARRRQIGALRAAVRVVSWLHDSGPEPIESTYPFLHRPLVDFCLAVPSEQFIRPGETRSLHRRALREFLPAAIAQRRGKRGPDEAVLRELSAGWGRVLPLLDDARVAQRGIVDVAVLRRALDQARFGRLSSDLFFALKVLALEAWLRALEREPRPEPVPAARPTAEGRI